MFPTCDPYTVIVPNIISEASVPADQGILGTSRTVRVAANPIIPLNDNLGTSTCIAHSTGLGGFSVCALFTASCSVSSKLSGMLYLSGRSHDPHRRGLYSL